MITTTKLDGLRDMGPFIPLPYSMLIYDIETSLMKARLFRLGEQRVNHKQLDKTRNTTEIICITAKWYGEKEIFTFTGEDAVKEFDSFARQADVCLGKNSDSFDVKHINSQRMIRNLTPYPEWMNIREDLEKQLRKYFNFPSQSLDYVSSLFGLGGKDKMEFSDWADIDDLRYINEFSEIRKDGKVRLPDNDVCLVFLGKPLKQVIEDGTIALKKMIEYNKKDVLDTESVLMRVLPYITLKRNGSISKVFDTSGKGCITCGSLNLIPGSVVVVGKTKFQQWNCLDHGGYGGKCTWHYKKGSHHKSFGDMGA